jgi:OOP family OmpA-OmpF porin
MRAISNRPGVLFLLATLVAPASASLSAQELEPVYDKVQTTVIGTPPADLSGMPAGPEIEGFISARKGDRMKVTSADGTVTVIAISDGTVVRASGGFLGINRDKLGADSLLNGLPVSVETVQWSDGLVASRVDLKSRDLKTAATEALRGRLGDIDKYNIKGTTNVYFDTGKWNLSARAQYDLCAAASEAEAMDNALLLVVGYTDSVGSEEYNQILSERRAGRVVNYLQQKCGWKPYRMLTPTGMAEADPLASNDTEAGKAQNRRVSVNILVSKSVDGL